jgi:tetratricopeptide (TPR) repeat protein
MKKNESFNKTFFCLVLILLVFNPVPIAAQQSAASDEELPVPILFYREKMVKGDYLGAVAELKRREAEYRNSQFKDMFLQVMSVLASQLGNYNEAYSYFDEFTRTFRKPEPDITASPLDKYAPRKALEIIDSVAERQQVVMINEEHDTPLHRAFTARLLPILYKKGFRYFAAETILDDEINRRGYPILKSGFYSADPVYGDLVRTAIKLGFKVVPYDLTPKDCKNPTDNPNHCQNERERGQAQNLYDRILKNDPQAKVLVHVGRTHNRETKLDNWALMGWHFKQITGIDPLTIDQTQMSERSRSESETAIFRYAVKKWNFNEPTVFQSEEEKHWSDSGYDLTVFHPRAIYKTNRPTWLQTDGTRKALKIDLKRLSLRPGNKQFGETEPILLQAFYANESADAVPVDQIIIYSNQKIPVLMLPAGSFRIRAMDKSGKEIGGYKVS